MLAIFLFQTYSITLQFCQEFFSKVCHHEISKILIWVDVSHTIFLYCKIPPNKLFNQNPVPMLLTAEADDGYLEVYYIIFSTLYMFVIFHNF